MDFDSWQGGKIEVLRFDQALDIAILTLTILTLQGTQVLVHAKLVINSPAVGQVEGVDGETGPVKKNRANRRTRSVVDRNRLRLIWSVILKASCGGDEASSNSLFLSK
jgi:hypothetical protein